MYIRYVFVNFLEGLGEELRGVDLGSRQARLAFAAALCSVLAYLAAVWLQLDKAEWAGISALVVSQGSVGASLSKGVLRIAGTFAGAVLAVLVVGLVADEPWLLLAVIFGVSVLTVYVSAFRTRDQYAWSMAGFLVVSMGIAGLEDPGVVFRLCVFRSLEIALGVSVASFCALFLGARAAADLRTGLVRIWQGLRTAFDAGLEELAGRRTDRDALNILASLRKDTDRLPRLLREARTEGSLTRAELACYAGLVGPSTSICRWLYQFFRQERRHTNALPAYFGAELQAVARAFEGLAEAVVSEVSGTGGRPGCFRAVRRAVEGLEQATDALVGAYEAWLAETGGGQSTFGERLRFNHLAQLLRRMHWTLADLENGSAASGAEITPGPDRRLALNMGLALGMAMVCIPLLWQWFDLPSPMGAAVAAFIVLHPDPVATWQKALLRISGCLMGGSLALFLVGMPLAQSFFPWVILIFCFLFCAMYINYGQARCSYAGLQAAIAMAVTFYQGNGPAASLEPPVLRLAAIFVGITVANTIANLLYPFHPERELRRLAAGLGSGLAPLLARVRGNRRPEDAAALKQLRTLYAKAPGLLRLAPETGRVSPAVLAALGGALENCRACAGLLGSLLEHGCPHAFDAWLPGGGERLQKDLDAAAQAMQSTFKNSVLQAQGLAAFAGAVRSTQEQLAKDLAAVRTGMRTVGGASRAQKLEVASWSVQLSGLLEELDTLAVRLQALAGCWNAGDFGFDAGAAGISVPETGPAG